MQPRDGGIVSRRQMELFFRNSPDWDGDLIVEVIPDQVELSLAVPGEVVSVSCECTGSGDNCHTWTVTSDDRLSGDVRVMIVDVLGKMHQRNLELRSANESNHMQ